MYIYFFFKTLYALNLDLYIFLKILDRNLYNIFKKFLIIFFFLIWTLFDRSN